MSPTDPDQNPIDALASDGEGAPGAGEPAPAEHVEGTPDLIDAPPLPQRVHPPESSVDSSTDRDLDPEDSAEPPSVDAPASAGDPVDAAAANGPADAAGSAEVDSSEAPSVVGGGSSGEPPRRKGGVLRGCLVALGVFALLGALGAALIVVVVAVIVLLGGGSLVYFISSLDDPRTAPGDIDLTQPLDDPTGADVDRAPSDDDTAVATVTDGRGDDLGTDDDEAIDARGAEDDTGVEGDTDGATDGDDGTADGDDAAPPAADTTSPSSAPERSSPPRTDDGEPPRRADSRSGSSSPSSEAPATEPASSRPSTSRSGTRTAEEQPTALVAGQGAVKLSGDGKVVLVKGRRRYPVPGNVPSGKYDIEVTFPGEPSAVTVGSVSVDSGETVTLACSARMGICRPR